MPENIENTMMECSELLTTPIETSGGQSITSVLNIIILPICLLSAVFGYALIAYQMKREQTKSTRFTQHVWAISFWDIALLLVFMALVWPSYVINGRAEWSAYGDSTWTIVFIGIELLKHVVRIGTHWQTVILATERYDNL